MNAKAKEFIAAAMADEQAKKKLDALPRPKNEAEAEAMLQQTLLPLASDMGFRLTLEDFLAADMGPVDDDELLAINGGFNGSDKWEDFLEDLHDRLNPDPHWTGVCSCIGYGQGHSAE